MAVPKAEVSPTRTPQQGRGTAPCRCLKRRYHPHELLRVALALPLPSRTLPWAARLGARVHRQSPEVEPPQRLVVLAEVVHEVGKDLHLELSGGAAPGAGRNVCRQRKGREWE